MKKIRGQIYYFGAWARKVDGKLVPIEGEDGWKPALEEYKKVADDLHAGRTPRGSEGELTVGELCNRFLTAKVRKVEAKELTSRLLAEYKEVTDLCVKQFGANTVVEKLTATDFADLRATMAKKWGPVRLGNSITRTKSIFKFGFENGHMERPVRYGSEFVKPDKSVLRRHRAKSAPKMFEAEELRSLIDGKDVEGENGKERIAPDVALRAMILLGVNLGFGNMDCANLTFDGLDLDGGWINFPRPKTGIERRCPLWPETVAAIRAALAVRVEPAGFPECGRAFLTVRGSPFIKITEKVGLEGEGENKKLFAQSNRKDLIGIQFGKLLTTLDIHRKRVGFYSLRHVFETVAGETRDQPAVDIVMGHADPSMAAHYRERVEDERLRAVVNHVRKWLWPDRV
jgi:integrase